MVSKQQYIRNQEIIRNRLAKLYVGQVYKALQSQIEAAIEVVKRDGVHTAAAQLPAVVINDQIGSVVLELYRTAASQAAKKYKPNIKAAGFGFDQLFINGILDYLKRFLLDKVVVPITNTTIAFIDAILKTAVKEGWGVDETVKNLRGSGITKNRAKMIVRTETVRATNYTQLAAADSEDFEMEKSWIAIEDKRTRRSHSHAGVDGERVPLYEPYSNGLMFPGDPDGAANETINCFLPHEITFVNPNIIKRVFRSRYNGKIVTIKTAGKRSFTCTVNHPILTNKGWVPAGQLTKGSNLIKSKSIDSFDGVNLNVQDVPTTFQEIYDSFLTTGYAMRVRRGIVNFHGDLPASDVDIISSKAALQDGFHPRTHECIKNILLPFADHAMRNLFGFSAFCVALYEKFGRKVSDYLVCGLGQTLSFCGAGLTHTQIHGSASVPAAYPRGSEPLRNHVAGNLELNGEGFDRVAFIVKADNLLSVNIGSNAVFKERETSFYDYVPDGVVCSPESFSDLLNTNSSLAKFDDVVDVVFHDYSGDVFTLETNNQMYDINGIISRNCRCTQGYFAARDLSGNLIPKKNKNITIMTALSMRHAA
jgi:hypothetical protein